MREHVVGLCAGTAVPADNRRPAVREGTPLRYNSQQVFFLTRSGRLLEFAPSKRKTLHRLRASFVATRRRKCAGSCCVSSGVLLMFRVAASFWSCIRRDSRMCGRRDSSNCSNSLHNTLPRQRGLRTPEPRFPLVAVVFARQADFARYATADGNPASSGMLGYYSPATNRIAMYDITAGRHNVDWTMNAETIIKGRVTRPRLTAACTIGLAKRRAGLPKD